VARINRINLPTWITLSRLVGIPFLLYLMQSTAPLQRWWAVALFAVIAATDWLDGYLARRLNQVTDLGKFLDPLVDKLMVMAPLLAFLSEGRLAVWGVFLILAREVAIAGWRVSQPQISGANLWGKLKTVSQIAAILLLLVPLGEPWPQIALVVFWLSVGLTLWSGLLYLLPQRD
jgi:CDP-diacylglycerol---glycerol-3-phosphate 3-phosphatidyltransferase